MTIFYKFFFVFGIFLIAHGAADLHKPLAWIFCGLGTFLTLIGLDYLRNEKT